MKHYQKIIICLVVMSAAIALAQGVLADQNTNAGEGGAPAEEMRLETQFPPIGDIRPEAGLPQFVQYLFMLGLGLGGVLAFGMIVFAGLQWSLSGASASLQGDAKDRIMNAILGLILLLGAFVILNTINPEIVQLRAVLQLDPIVRSDLPIVEPPLHPMCAPWVEFTCHQLPVPEMTTTCPPGWQVLEGPTRFECMPTCGGGYYVCGLPRPIGDEILIQPWCDRPGSGAEIRTSQVLVRLPPALEGVCDSAGQGPFSCLIGQTSLERYQLLHDAFISNCQASRFECRLTTTSTIRDPALLGFRPDGRLKDVLCHLPPDNIPGLPNIPGIPDNMISGSCIDFIISRCINHNTGREDMPRCLTILYHTIATSPVARCLNEYDHEDYGGCPSRFATGNHIHCRL